MAIFVSPSKIENIKRPAQFIFNYMNSGSIIFILLTTLLFAPKTNLAQEDSRTIHFGLKVAPSIAWLKPQVNTVKSNGLSIRFIYGMIFDYCLTKNFWFGTGLDITYLGGNLSYPNSNEINNKVFPDLPPGYTPIKSSNYTVQFLELPLTFKIKTNQTNRMKYVGQAGLNSGVKLNAFAKHNLLGYKQPKIRASDEVNPFRLAINISGGIEYKLTSFTNLQIGITYNSSFTNLFKGNSPIIRQTEDNQSIKLLLRSNYVAFNIGYLL